MDTTRYLLPEDAIPTHWYNVVADLDALPPPPLNPGTGSRSVPTTWRRFSRWRSSSRR